MWRARPGGRPGASPATGGGMRCLVGVWGPVGCCYRLPPRCVLGVEDQAPGLYGFHRLGEKLCLGMLLVEELCCVQVMLGGYGKTLPGRASKCSVRGLLARNGWIFKPKQSIVMLRYMPYRESRSFTLCFLCQIPFSMPAGG